MVTPSQPMRLQMNPTLKSKAWKLVEIIFYVALVLLVVIDIDWKSFLVWSLDFVLIVGGWPILSAQIVS